jgi:hypothetical protein
MKNALLLATPATEIALQETAPLDAVDMEAIEDILCSAQALLDRAIDARVRRG